MSRLYKIRFYEEKDARGKPRLRFEQLEQFIPTNVTIDELYARSTPVKSITMQNGEAVPVANSMFRMFYYDTKMQNIDPYQIFQITS